MLLRFKRQHMMCSDSFSLNIKTKWWLASQQYWKEEFSNLWVWMPHYHLTCKDKWEAVHFQLNKTPIVGEDFCEQPNWSALLLSGTEFHHQQHYNLLTFWRPLQSHCLTDPCIQRRILPSPIYSLNWNGRLQLWVPWKYTFLNALSVPLDHIALPNVIAQKVNTKPSKYEG